MDSHLTAWFIGMVSLVGAAVFGAFCGYVAQEKRRPSGPWIFFGVLFNFIALIAIAGLPELSVEEQERRKRQREEEKSIEITRD